MRYVILTSFVIFLSISIRAQISNEKEYRIDASERQTTSPTHQSLPQSYLGNGASSENTAVVINDRLYQSMLLTRLMPYIQNNKYKVSIDVLKEPKELAMYTDDKRFNNIVLVKMPKKLARKLRKENADLVLK